MLTPEIVIITTLRVGVVYKITAPELITTEQPHYFVVVAISDSDNYMLLSTSQLQSKIKYLTKRGYDLDTLAYISPNKQNGLTKDSYFNCNDSFTITKRQLIEKVRQGNLLVAGKLSLDEYNKLVYSMNLSYVNDIPKFLLKYDAQ